MDSHLILQKGEKLFLLLKNAEDFHLVSVDKRLTAEAEEKLLASYPCSDASLRELGIHFQRLTPRGVAAGDNVQIQEHSGGLGFGYITLVDDG